MALASYDQKFFDTHLEGSLRSARVIAPLVVENFPIKSVVDFGCGLGAWLKVFQELGIDDTLGLDGEYVDKTKLVIEPASFRTTDLTEQVNLEREFDLAVCLEVGEHLPKSASVHLVASLTSAARVILFSAAIPGQGGTIHINEQWPRFWENLFSRRGYRKIDLIRGQILGSKEVKWWYRQNTVLYVKNDVFESISLSKPWICNNSDLEIVHKDILSKYSSFRGLLRETIRAGYNSIQSKLDS